jgi:hypothetical protein
MPEGTELAGRWLGPSSAPEDAADNSASTLFMAALAMLSRVTKWVPPVSKP